MEVDSIQEALRDFDKKSKKEPSPVLEEFLCHVAKTGQTMVQWSQFKNYFLFKLEKVMDDFRASAPEHRGAANPNVESVPFEDMKERILKIVSGYNGIPFTIQRLCELLTEPKRNYTGTDKFLRGVEKNVMVVSCVHPTSEKNGSTSVNRMNGVMVPGSTSAFTERKVNGPGTPRPLCRPKVSLANTVAANGLPDSTDNKDLNTEQEGSRDSSEALPSDGSPESAVKNKHSDDEEEEEEDMEAEHQEVKRLKFSKEEDDEEEEEEEETDAPRPSDSSCASQEAEAMVQLKEEHREDSEASSSAAARSEDQEPSSSTPAEMSASSAEEERAEREVPCGSEEEASDMDQTEQQAPAGEPEPDRDGGEGSSDPVSSSSSSSSSSSCCSSEEAAETAASPSSSTPEPPTEGATSSSISDTGTTEEPMEQD